MTSYVSILSVLGALLLCFKTFELVTKLLNKKTISHSGSYKNSHRK